MTHPQTPTGMAILQDPALNKGTAFTEEERDRLGLRGLLPPAVFSQQVQMDRILDNLRRKESDIERYILLHSLQGRNERLFYRLVLEHITEIMPLIYTPTVGEACKEFAHIYRQPKGFYISANDRGRVRELLDNWPERDVRVIVVTDGERILGLGDLGANGMGIAIGKLSLYTAAAGIAPEQCLPVMLDTGTDNRALRENPLYLGIRRERLRGEAYLELFEEFVQAVQDAFPLALLHFEDFASDNAHRLIDIYRDRMLCFNDDIQGTGGVTLAGLYAATRITGDEFSDLRVLFLGAGSAAIGVADLVAAAFIEAGMSEAQACSRIWLVDQDGLVVQDREGLGPHVRRFAQDRAPLDFIGAIQAHAPQALIGATGAPGTFSEQVVGLMAELNPRPIIFALSNPTANAECTAEQAYQWSGGRAVFASGSPFGPVSCNGTTLRPAQCNNVYVFPGLGLGALSAGVERITNALFLAAARALADQVDAASLEAGALYPELTRVRRISIAVARAVFEAAQREGLTTREMPEDIEAELAARMYDPVY